MTELGTRGRGALLVAIRRATLAMRAATAEGRFEIAMARLGGLLHARRLERRYNPNWPSQPRVPRGHSEGGRWTDGGASGGEALQPSAFEEAVSGDNLPPAVPASDEPGPRVHVPRERPTDPDVRNGIIRGVADWARALSRSGGAVGLDYGLHR